MFCLPCSIETDSELFFFPYELFLCHSDLTRHRMADMALILSLLHMKVTSSVTKSTYQDHSSCNLLLPISFLYIFSPLLLQNENLLWLLFASANSSVQLNILLVQLHIVLDYSSA